MRNPTIFSVSQSFKGNPSPTCAVTMNTAAPSIAEKGRMRRDAVNGASQNVLWTSAALVFISGAAAGHFSSLADDDQPPTSAMAIAAFCCD